MKALTAAVLLLAAGLSVASLRFSQDGSGSVLKWDAFDHGYEALVIRCARSEYDASDTGWGLAIATVTPGADGVFPTEVRIPAAFIVDPGDCIACGICVSECPVDAISTDDEGKAVIDTDACIACGICASACPVNAILAPGPGLFYGLFGINADGSEEFVLGSQR